MLLQNLPLDALILIAECLLCPQLPRHEPTRAWATLARACARDVCALAATCRALHQALADSGVLAECRARRVPCAPPLADGPHAFVAQRAREHTTKSALRGVEAACAAMGMRHGRHGARFRDEAGVVDVGSVGKVTAMCASIDGDVVWTQSYEVGGAAHEAAVELPFQWEITRHARREREAAGAGSVAVEWHRVAATAMCAPLNDDDAEHGATGRCAKRETPLSLCCSPSGATAAWLVREHEPYDDEATAHRSVHARVVTWAGNAGAPPLACFERGEAEMAIAPEGATDRGARTHDFHAPSLAECAPPVGGRCRLHAEGVAFVDEAQLQLGAFIATTRGADGAPPRYDSPVVFIGVALARLVDDGDGFERRQLVRYFNRSPNADTSHDCDVMRVAFAPHCLDAPRAPSPLVEGLFACRGDADTRSSAIVHLWAAHTGEDGCGGSCVPTRAPPARKYRRERSSGAGEPRPLYATGVALAARGVGALVTHWSLTDATMPFTYLARTSERTFVPLFTALLDAGWPCRFHHTGIDHWRAESMCVGHVLRTSLRRAVFSPPLSIAPSPCGRHFLVLVECAHVAELPDSPSERDSFVGEYAVYAIDTTRGVARPVIEPWETTGWERVGLATPAHAAWTARGIVATARYDVVNGPYGCMDYKTSVVTLPPSSMAARKRRTAPRKRRR